MKKELLNEIDRMRFLVGYSKGRVISEQNPSSSLGEKKQEISLLKHHLVNDILGEWKWLPDEDFEQDGIKHYAITSKKRLSFKKYYLSEEGIYYKIKNDQKTPIGEWYYKYNYPKNSYNFYLEPYKKEETSPVVTTQDVTTQDVTTQDQIPVTNTNDTPQPNTGATTQDVTTNAQNVQANDKLKLQITIPDNPELTKRFEELKGKLPKPIKNSTITNPFDQEKITLTASDPNVDIDVLAPIEGIVVSINSWSEEPTYKTVVLKHGDYLTVYSPLLISFTPNTALGRTIGPGGAIGTIPSDLSSYASKKNGELDFSILKQGQGKPQEFLNPEDWIQK
jgi:hypothetical protein